jgi:hypothetical protein
VTAPFERIGLRQGGREQFANARNLREISSLCAYSVTRRT